MILNDRIHLIQQLHYISNLINKEANLYILNHYMFDMFINNLELIKIEFILFGIIDNILNTLSFDVLLKTMKSFLYIFSN